ncbi:hypothetical protein Tco_0815086 [Tanacetum coccineum]
METASRFTRDAVTTILVWGQDIPDDVKCPVTGKLKNFKLYLMRRSLEVLREFYWMILGGRFNQLSYFYRTLGTMFNLSVGGNKS